jgi:serine/threonine protein kinase
VQAAHKRFSIATVSSDRWATVHSAGPFLARDETGMRDVAVKVFDSRENTDWKAYELFDREAAVLRSLRHHGIPEIIDSFRDQWEGRDASFLVLEYVKGTSLSTLIVDRTHLEQRVRQRDNQRIEYRGQRSTGLICSFQFSSP